MYSTYYYRIKRLDPLIFGRMERHATDIIRLESMPPIEQSK